MKNKINNDNEIYYGHRKRMRERLFNIKFGTISDYDLLEMLLFYAMPRGDVKPIAKELMKRYGSFAKIICISHHELSTIKGIGESALACFRIVKEASAKLIKEDMVKKPILESWSALLNYVRSTMGHMNTEQFKVIYLDKKYMILDDELQEIGTVDHTPVYPREIIKRALSLEASNLILVHNHPSGNTKPSKSDIVLTAELSRLTNALGIKIIDHIIISHSDYYSFSNNGLL